MNKNYWSKWRDIVEASKYERGKYGVYEIRLCDNDKKPLPIPRMLKRDTGGILYIGRARPKMSIAKRIGMFERASRLKTLHSGGNTYFLLMITYKRLKGREPKRQLQYRVHRMSKNSQEHSNKVDSFKERISIEECSVMANYFAKYCELPPCNSNFPSKWEWFKDKLEDEWIRA